MFLLNHRETFFQEIYYKLELNKLISDLNMNERIEFLPLVSPNELIEFLSQYDCAVNLLINPDNLISRNYHGLNKIYMIQSLLFA